MDRSVRPQDDFFRFVNGAWADKTPIPADRPSYGTIAILRERSEEAVRSILEAEAIKPAAPGSIGQKVGGFYKSFIDAERIEALGSQPLAAELAAIGSIAGVRDFPDAFARASRVGVRVPGRRPGPAALRRVRRARLAGGSRDARPRLLPAPGRTIRRDS
jgi:predicted metalloendopeptidase